MTKLEDFLKYDGIGLGKYNGRPYDIACLEKDDRLRSFAAQYARSNNVSVILDCPEEDVLAILQQSKLSLTLANSDLMWASLAQGCTTFINGEPQGMENHIHHVEYSLDDLHLAAYNVQRFLHDYRHAADIGRNGYEFVLDVVKNGPLQAQVEFSNECSDIQQEQSEPTEQLTRESDVLLDNSGSNNQHTVEIN